MRTIEEQVADLENQFGEEGTFTFVDDRDAATKHIIEAEQHGFERARAECAADTRRLEWLAKHACYYNMAPENQGIPDWKDLSETDFRTAIDAAMEGGK